MYIFIDNRETVLKDRLSGLQNVVLGNLDIGDIVIGESEAPSPATLRMVFERKTLADLTASIKDGRHHEQKARLLEWRKEDPTQRRLYYVIEGYRPGMTTDKMQVGGILNTLFRDNIPVLLMRDVGETAAFLTETWTRLLADPAKYLSTADPSAASATGSAECDYVSQVKMKRNKNITPATVFLYQLSQIPGISAKLAAGIAAVHPTMTAFVHALDAFDTPEAKSRYIENIPIDERRKVGKKTAVKILEHL